MRFVDIEGNAVTEVIGRRAFRSRADIQEFLDNIPTADVIEAAKVEEAKQNLLQSFYWQKPQHDQGQYSLPQSRG